MGMIQIIVSVKQEVIKFKIVIKSKKSTRKGTFL